MSGDELRGPAPHAFVADLSAPVLDPDDRHHLERVLRMRAGDRLTVSDGAGAWRACRFGPDLTHLMSRRTIASGAAENTPENLRLWIRTPDAIKPGSLMPAMKVSDTDLDALVRYMESLR